MTESSSEWLNEIDRLRRALAEIVEIAQREYPVSIGNQYAWAEVMHIAAQASAKESK